MHFTMPMCVKIKIIFISETAESVKEDIQVLAGTVVMEKG